MAPGWYGSGLPAGNAGKFTDLERALALLRPGGIFLVDDLLPQESWPLGHAPKVPELMRDLEAHAGLANVRLAWASGLLIAIATGPSTARYGGVRHQ